MTWRVRIEPDIYRGGDRVAIGRPVGDRAEVVEWGSTSEIGR